MSSEKPSKSNDPACSDAASDAEQIEQQLAGLAESHFARKKQEIKTAQESSGKQVFGKLLNKVEGLTRGKPQSTQDATPAQAASDAPSSQQTPILAEPVAVKPVPAQRVAAGLDVAALSAAVKPIALRLAKLETALEHLSTSAQQRETQAQQAIKTLLEHVSRQETGINNIAQFLRKQAQTPSQAQPVQPQQPAAAAPAIDTASTSAAERPRSRLIPERKPAAAAVPVASVPVAAEQPRAVSSGNWHRAVFGPELAAHAQTTRSRQQMLDAVARGEGHATTLVGLLLMFQAAAPDRRPQMLKDIGEAYYRWRTDANADPDAMRAALVEGLMKKCEESGKANTIELVSPGDRFDNTRHHAHEKGAEIVRVFGWVVLRDSGKVYTKASVAVQ